MMDKSCLCMRCMRETVGFEVCMHCGYINNGKVSHHSHLSLGTILQGRYVIGMSVYFSDKEIWYAGFDFSLQRRVYVRECLVQQLVARQKNSPYVYAVDAESGERFETVKRQFITGLTVAMHLNSKVIVNVFDIFEENNTAYAVTEWIDGVMLSDFIINNNSVCSSPAVIKNIALQLAGAIQKVNEEGYVHTCLTPESIWMCNDGTIRLVAFLSMQSMLKHNQERQFSSNALIAPEVYDIGAKLSPATDVYSLAALLYRLLCGEYPPIALEREIYDNYTGLRFINSDMPAPMARAIDKALSLEPSERYKDIDRFMTAFMEDYVTVETIDAATIKKRGAKRVRVHAVPIIAAILAMILGLMLVVASASLYTVKLYCTPELDEAFELAAAATNKQNRLCGFKKEITTIGADVFMYSPDANKENLINTKNMSVDVENNSVLDQYIKQNGDSVCLPLGYSVYAIFTNIELADDTFMAAEIAELMLDTSSTNDEDKQEVDDNQANSDGADAMQPAIEVERADTAQEPNQTEIQTIDLIPEIASSMGGQNSIPLDIKEGKDAANSVCTSERTKLGIEEHGFYGNASKLVCIMPDAYDALNYLYGNDAVSRLYSAQKTSFENALDAFATGKAAYIIANSTNYAEISQLVTDLGLMLLWVPEERAYPVSAQLCISERTAVNSRNAESATMFINELVGKDVQESIFLGGAFTGTIILPINKEIRNEVLTKMYQTFFGKEPNAFDVIYFVD